ncbi:MAG: hypothetical protein KDK62_02645 [Chlamydiia bacterium]|nr:hypothetical protein [Chlamydiia bacterium]
MVAAAPAPVPPQTFQSLYWDRSKESLKDTVYKVFVVAREALITVATIGLFLFNPTLFLPFFFAGILLRDPLNIAFDHLHKLSTISLILTGIIVFVGAILAFPASGWVACALVALWAGKRCADLGHIYHGS